MTSAKRLAVAEHGKTVEYLLAAPLVGYKFVTASFRPPVCVGAREHLAVGSRHKLADGATPAVGCLGYHFATTPLLLMNTVTWEPTYRLVRIEVPAGATVSTNGVTYAASELRVVADETASAAALLTGVTCIVRGGVITYNSYVAGAIAAEDGAPVSMQLTADGFRTKHWRTEGRLVSAHQAHGTPVIVYGHATQVSRDVWEARFKTKEWYET
jgi:hypothetical protein